MSLVIPLKMPPSTGRSTVSFNLNLVKLRPHKNDFCSELLDELPIDKSKCRMETCFDLSLCRNVGFTIYVYPHKEDINGKISKLFSDVLDSIKRSHYYTTNADKACIKGSFQSFFRNKGRVPNSKNLETIIFVWKNIFSVLAIDSMDRDPLSKERFVKNFGGRLQNINGWNGGRNHIIFNLFSGTWPEYLEELGFDLGYAILAKASISKQKYRPGFDISLPLWECGF